MSQQQRQHNYRNRVPSQIVSGPGCIDQLAEQLKRLGVERVFIVSTGSLEKNGMLRDVEARLGSRLAGTYAGCRAHTPKSTVDEALAQLSESGADWMLALGGGSVVDTVKAVAHEFFLQTGRFPRSIAIPTTLSVSEFTPFAGVMDDTTRQKASVSDIRVIPELIFLDPECVKATPPQLWLGSGMKALDHALEAIWAKHPHPVSTVLAKESVEKLLLNLPLCVTGQTESRTQALYECQMGAWLGVSACLNTGGRLSHTLGHQIGGHWGVPHGFTSCIVLPHVMRFLATSATEQQQCIADSFGVDKTLAPVERIHLAADHLTRFIADLGLPGQLSQTAARKENLDTVSRAVVRELQHQQASSEQLSKEQVTELLLSMW